MKRHVTWSLLDELNADETNSRIEGNNVAIVQPCLFAFQVALAEAWKSWGIEPDAVIGHSMGEISAAHMAVALGLADATGIIVERSRLLQQAMEELPCLGAMAAIRVSADQARELIQEYEDRVWIAVHNSPSYTVLSGDLDALEQIVARLRQQKIGARMMNVPGAAHTPRLEPTRIKLEAAVAGFRPQKAAVPFYSTVTGRQRPGDELDAEYWGRNIREGVRFAPAIDQLSADGYGAFLEIGPHPLLGAAITQCLEHRGQRAVVLPSLRQANQDSETMLGSLGALYANGLNVDWHRLYPGRRRWVDLPTYPWQTRRCWIEPAPIGPITSQAVPSPVVQAEMPTDRSSAAVRPDQSAEIEPAQVCSSVVPELLQAVREAPAEQKLQRLQDYLRGQIAHTLGTDAARIDPEYPVTQLGIDSLMAIEIKNRVEAELQVELQLVQLLQGRTIAGLADALLAEAERLQAEGTQAESGPEHRPTKN